MRTACLYFPSLALHLARCRHLSTQDRRGPVVLVTGEGDAATVQSVSASATRRGVVPGMSIPEARWRGGSGLLVLSDNPGDCYDALERLATILRRRATPFVAIGGRDHLFVRIPDRWATDEPAFARFLANVTQTWLGLSPRIAVAGSLSEACAAASAPGCRTLRLCEAAAAEGPDAFPSSAPVRIDVTVRTEGRTWIPALRRALSQLDAILAGLGEAFRGARVSFGSAEVATRRFHDPAPHAASLLGWVAELAANDHPETIRIELSGLVPWTGAAAHNEFAMAS